MKNQFYILTTADVVDKYESLTIEDFIQQLTADDVRAFIIGNINYSDTNQPNMDWLWILEDEIKMHIMTITNNTNNYIFEQWKN
jgi:hypothetical protein